MPEYTYMDTPMHIQTQYCNQAYACQWLMLNWPMCDGVQSSLNEVRDYHSKSDQVWHNLSAKLQLELSYAFVKRNPDVWWGFLQHILFGDISLSTQKLLHLVGYSLGCTLKSVGWEKTPPPVFKVGQKLYYEHFLCNHSIHYTYTSLTQVNIGENT